MALKDPKKLQESSAKYQYLAAFVVNLLAAGYGASCGWVSPSILLLTSDESPLPTGKITMEEASWAAAFVCVGGLVGNFFFGFVTNAFGRKWPMIANAIPAIIGWSLILFAKNVYYLYVARLIIGFVGGGVFVIIPVFLSEIANDRIRGVLGSTMIFSYNIGVLIAFILGNYFGLYATPKFVIVLTIVFAISLCFFPETPSFLMKQNKIEAAEKSLRFYQDIRGKADDLEVLQAETEKLKKSTGGENPEKSETDKNDENAFKWSNLWVNPGRKAMTIGIVMAALNQFAGSFAMLNYTASIFKEAGSSMPPNMSAIFIGVIQLLGSYMATYLVDRAGRKFLFAVSTIGTALGLTTLGVYMMLKSWQYNIEAFNWIPVASFSFVIFISSWAILTLPFLVISEVMPENLKDFGVSFCTILTWIFSFIMLKFLPNLTETLGFHGSMFLFTGVCLVSALYIIKCMPETRGKSYQQIMNSLQ